MHTIEGNLTKYYKQRDLMKQSNVYKEKIIAYLDVLGFRDLVNSDKSNAEKPRNVLEHFRDVPFTLKDDKYIGPFFDEFQYIFFSDTIVISLPLHRSINGSNLSSLEAILWLLVQTHIHLIPKGIVFRGALHIGSIYDEDVYIFGSGFQEVFDLEKSDAVYPIVIVSDELIEHIENNKSDDDVYLFNSDKGHYISNLFNSYNYVNYLDSSYFITETMYCEFVLEHKKFIISELESHKDKPRILRKYKWLSRYHDECVSRWFPDNPNFNINDYLINIIHIGNNLYKKRIIEKY